MLWKNDGEIKTWIVFTIFQLKKMLNCEGKKMENKIVMSASKTASSDYFAWFEELKSRYRSSQLKAGLNVNRELLQFNWNLGKDI